MAAAPSRVGTTFGKYRIVRLLGKGGMGEVYEAYDTSKDRTVALKILPDQFSHDEKFRTRFQRESHATAILQEPHVIPIHDWGEIDGHLYIDMRLVVGHTLHELLRAGGLEPHRAVAIINQIAEALDAAHTHGLVHRDVKPQNVIVTSSDFAYLVDFGIASMAGASSLTMTGTQIGSMSYMAPERFAGTDATPAVDVYSLACILYELLVGSPPFPADSPERTIAAHLSAPVPRANAVNPGIPPGLDEVIARGMAKHPEDRYGTAGALGRAAQRALQPSAAAPGAARQAGAAAPWAVTTQADAGVPPQRSVSGPHAAFPPVLQPPATTKSSPWLTLAAVTAALIAVGIAIAGYFRSPVPDSASPGAATAASHPTFTAQQIADATQNVCAGLNSTTQAITRNTHLQNPTPDDPIGALAVAANARLALSHSAMHLRALLTREPATPTALADAVGSIADAADDLALSYLAGEEDSARSGLRNDLDSGMSKSKEFCP